MLTRACLSRSKCRLRHIVSTLHCRAQSQQLDTPYPVLFTEATSHQSPTMSDIDNKINVEKSATEHIDAAEKATDNVNLNNNVEAKSVADDYLYKVTLLTYLYKGSRTRLPVSPRRRFSTKSKNLPKNMT